MPTDEKVRKVAELKELIERCTIAISTDYTGVAVGPMTDLRRALRQKGIDFRVVKNTLAYLAADAAGKPGIKEVVRGPTGIAFSYGDPTEPARTISQFVRATRLPLQIKGAVMGDQTLSAQEVESLARLPSKEELVALVLGRLQAPIVGLVYVLQAPISALARVLQRRLETVGDAGSTMSEVSPQDAPQPPAADGGSEAQPDIAESAPVETNATDGEAHREK